MTEFQANEKLQSRAAERDMWAKVLAPSENSKARKPRPMVISGARVRLICFVLDAALVFGAIAGAFFIFG